MLVCHFVCVRGVALCKVLLVQDPSVLVCHSVCVCVGEGVALYKVLFVQDLYVLVCHFVCVWGVSLCVKCYLYRTFLC